ncbi:Uncharacterised protein [uncultured archaeon]|nr:Uncharacterised protein [uncultured archaeon]
MRNWRVVIFSIIAIICMILVFTIDWLFIIPAVILVILSQRELTKRKNGK